MLFSTFDNVVSKLGTEINKIAFTKRSILEKSREYSQVKNDYESGYEYFQKGNSSPKIMKAISEKWKTFQKRYIKEMKSLEKSQTNSQKEVDKILQKNSELAILTLYSKFLTDSQYSKLSINLVKGHKQGLISNDTLINSLQEYRKFKRMDFEKGSVYVKDNRAQYGDMILINDRNEILFLIRNKNDEFEPGKYCLPGGHIDSSENAKAGAVRELEEETGIIVSIDEVIPAGNYIDNKINIHYFTAKYNGDPVVLEEREQIQFEWVPLDKVVDKPLLKNLKENLKEIIDLPKEVINPFAPLGNLYYYGTLLIKSENDQILQRHLNVVCEAYNEGILSGNDLRKALISVPCLSIEYDIVRASNGIKHFVKLVPPKDVLQKGELHGLAFDKTLEEIAEHHKEDIDVIQMQFRMGVEVEMEHTKEKEVAERIAKDHLWETPIYYTKLKEVEKQEVKKALSNVGIDVSDEDWLEKAKYLRRTGVPGNYKYEYDEAKNKKIKIEDIKTDRLIIKQSFSSDDGQRIMFEAFDRQSDVPDWMKQKQGRKVVDLTLDIQNSDHSIYLNRIDALGSKGFGKEVLSNIINELKSKGFSKFTGYIENENIRSQKMLESLGAKKVKETKDGAYWEISESNLVPIGEGKYGPIYDQFKGKPKEAIDFIGKNKKGDAIEVWKIKRPDTLNPGTKKEVSVDVIWGDKNHGLDHIISKHIELHNDFENFEQMRDTIIEIMSSVSNETLRPHQETKDHIVYLTKEKKKVVVGKAYEDDKKEGNVIKHFILSSYDDSRRPEDKKIVKGSHQNLPGSPLDSISDETDGRNDCPSNDSLSQHKYTNYISEEQIFAEQKDQNELEKAGKPAQIGEIREWNGQKMKKTSQGWVLVSENKQPKLEEKTEDKTGEENSNEEVGKNLTPEKLEEFARNTSTENLQRAAEGQNEQLRLAAKKELVRRKTEEDPENNEDKLLGKDLAKQKDILTDKYREVMTKMSNITDFSSTGPLQKLTREQRQLSTYIQRVQDMELNPKDQKLQWDTLFKITDIKNENELATVLGDGKILSMQCKGDSNYYEIKSLSEECCVKRIFYTQEKNVIMNEFILNPELERSKGYGSQIFANQVQEFKKMGFKTLETEAVRSDIYNGYYTWAVLGYEINPTNTTQIEEFQKLVSNSKNKRIKNVKNLSELVSFKEGAQYWKENGFSFEGVFDLNENSNSMKIFNNYMQYRKNKTDEK